MLHILFSPSEGKNQGGTYQKQELFGALEARKEILTQYNRLIHSDDTDAICKLFGIKKFQECQKYIVDIFNAPLLKAIQRYQGVAYDHLNYATLDQAAQAYLHAQTIIFSNLYGPLRGGDCIPIYKVKQTNSIADIEPEKFYKERFSYQLDLYLADSDILDLRAGYYDKFYKPNKPYTTLKFLKNGKVVSHWAKAYRGVVLRACAQANITSLEQFHSLEIDNLSVYEIKKTKNKTEIVYTIME